MWELKSSFCQAGTSAPKKLAEGKDRKEEERKAQLSGSLLWMKLLKRRFAPQVGSQEMNPSCSEAGLFQSKVPTRTGVSSKTPVLNKSI